MVVETSTTLKDTLCVQQQLLQKLYNELEVEREASATAASEALAMILRLQGEKAAVKMEAEHYKRLSEEKMYHAEESMELFEDLIQQKEMEIANLDYQVQAYRYKLSSLGFEETGSHEIKYPENLLQLSDTSSVAETSSEILLRRNSAPPKLLKLAYMKRGNLERNRSVSPDSDMVSKNVEESERKDESNQNLDSWKQMDGSISSYWDQIRKLDKIVEEMAGEQYISLRGRSSRSSSAFSQINESDQTQNLKKLVDNEMLSDSCSLRVHDVFEVPATNEILVKDNGKSILNGEDKIEKVVYFQEEAMKLYEKSEIRMGEETLLNHKDKQVFLPRDNILIDCHVALDLPAADVVGVQGSSQLPNITTEITEGESDDLRSQEQLSSSEREDVFRLLHEINEKLDSIQSEIKSGKPEKKRSSPNLDLPMLQLQEAMLHFWL
nr:hypothetical protein [Tanacetum cinerariifolium]